MGKIKGLQLSMVSGNKNFLANDSILDITIKLHHVFFSKISLEFSLRYQFMILFLVKTSKIT